MRACGSAQLEKKERHLFVLSSKKLEEGTNTVWAELFENSEEIFKSVEKEERLWGKIIDICRENGIPSNFWDSPYPEILIASTRQRLNCIPDRQLANPYVWLLSILSNAPEMCEYDDYIPLMIDTALSGHTYSTSSCHAITALLNLSQDPEIAYQLCDGVDAFYDCALSLGSNERSRCLLLRLVAVLSRVSPQRDAIGLALINNCVDASTENDKRAIASFLEAIEIMDNFDLIITSEPMCNLLVSMIFQDRNDITSIALRMVRVIVDSLLYEPLMHNLLKTIGCCSSDEDFVNAAVIARLMIESQADAVDYTPLLPICVRATENGSYVRAIPAFEVIAAFIANVDDTFVFDFSNVITDVSISDTVFAVVERQLEFQSPEMLGELEEMANDLDHPRREIAQRLLEARAML